MYYMYIYMYIVIVCIVSVFSDLFIDKNKYYL